MVPRLHVEKIIATAYGREEPILSNVTLSIEPEEFVVVLGHNGSGKSTLVKILSGGMAPSSGNIYIDNIPMQDISESERAIELITLSQRPEDRLFMNLTLMENIILLESRFPSQHRLNAEQIIALTNHPKRFLEQLKQPLGHFSGGEKQSILLALALAHPPRVLFLDEHTSSLDPKASHQVMVTTSDAIRDHKITALMVTHSLEDAIKYGDRLIILNEGKVVVDQKKTNTLSVHELKEMME